MNKKKMHPLLRILVVFFIIYLALFILNETGYYQNTVRDQAILTEKQKEKFEEDIKNGKMLNTSSYLPKKEDYSNGLTKSANFIADELGSLLDDKLANLLHLLKALIAG